MEQGSGCGSVGRVVASDSGVIPVIGKIYIEYLFCVNCNEL